VQFPERVLKDVVPSDVNSQLFTTDALVQPVQLRSEIAPLDVKVKDACVVRQNGEWAVSQVCVGLAQDLIQHSSVHF